jgi:hypothetical protein
MASARGASMQMRSQRSSTMHTLQRLLIRCRQHSTHAPTGQRVEGRLRLVTRTKGWEGYVRLAFDEIRLAGVFTPQVARRL